MSLNRAVEEAIRRRLMNGDHFADSLNYLFNSLPAQAAPPITLESIRQAREEVRRAERRQTPVFNVWDFGRPLPVEEISPYDFATDPMRLRPEPFGPLTERQEREEIARRLGNVDFGIAKGFGVEFSANPPRWLYWANGGHWPETLGDAEVLNGERRCGTVTTDPATGEKVWRKTCAFTGRVYQWP